MLQAGEPKLFGGATRTRALIAIVLLKGTYPREVAALLGVSTPTIAKIIDDLEAEGVIVSRFVGRTRTLSLNPRMYGIADLETFLQKYAKSTDMEERLSQVRRRPRRRTKEI
jgi:biotin operon repressor